MLKRRNVTVSQIFANPSLTFKEQLKSFGLLEIPYHVEILRNVFRCDKLLLPRWSGHTLGLKSV